VRAVGSTAVLATGLMLSVGASTPVWAQDSPPPAAEAPPSSNAAASPSASSTATKPGEPVCFKLTGHCVDSSKAAKSAPAGAGAAAKSDTASAKTTAKDKKKLNLSAPDVSTVVPEQELKQPLPSENQITEVQESQTVAVHTDEGVPPDVPGGLGAIWWAVVHPSQAWRIVTPAE